ncbi:MAG: hypothetical protein VCB82_06895, partial [Alphaproteobacteria bacterium]
DRRSRTGSIPHPVRGTRMVAVGQKDAGNAFDGDSFEVILGWFDGINANAAVGNTNEMAIEVIVMRFGKARPRKDIGDNLSHNLRYRFPLTEQFFFVSYMMEEGAAPRQESNYQSNPKTAKALEWQEKAKPSLR